MNGDIAEDAAAGLMTIRLLARFQEREVPVPESDCRLHWNLRNQSAESKIRKAFKSGFRTDRLVRPWLTVRPGTGVIPRCPKVSPTPSIQFVGNCDFSMGGNALQRTSPFVVRHVPQVELRNPASSPPFATMKFDPIHTEVPVVRLPARTTYA
jgi:hypothetical protein